MTPTPPNKGPLRYRLYFWLMDICLIFAGIGLADYLLDRVAGVEFDDNSPLYIGFGVIVLFFNFAVPIFLFCARFMRDEYAQSIFQRTLVVLAYFAAIAPVIVLCSAWMHYFATGTGGKDSPFSYLYVHDAYFWLLITIWMSYMLLFVGIFQFLRWKDSR